MQFLNFKYSIVHQGTLELIAQTDDKYVAYRIADINGEYSIALTVNVEIKRIYTEVHDRDYFYIVAPKDNRLMRDLWVKTWP